MRRRQFIAMAAPFSGLEDRTAATKLRNDSRIGEGHIWTDLPKAVPVRGWHVPGSGPSAFCLSRSRSRRMTGASREPSGSHRRR
jgi:hypothetical protein